MYGNIGKLSAFWKAVYHCLTAESPEEQHLQQLLARPFDTLQLVNEEFVVTLLYIRLGQSSCLSDFPSEMVELMETLYATNLERNQAIIAQYLRVAKLLCSAGITPLFLKGSAYLQDHIYPDPGMRMLSDIDILVAEAELERAQSTLLETGYTRLANIPDGWRMTDLCHLPPLGHPEERTWVELHYRLLESPHADALPVSSFFTGSRLVNDETGLTYRIPGPQWLIKHHFAHHYLADKVYARKRRWNLRQLCDLHFICDRFARQIDYSELDHYFTEHGYKDAWECYKLEYRYFDDDSPFEAFQPSNRAMLSFKLMQARLGGRKTQIFMDSLFWLLDLPKRMASPSWYFRRYVAVRSLIRRR